MLSNRHGLYKVKCMYIITNSIVMYTHSINWPCISSNIIEVNLKNKKSVLGQIIIIILLSIIIIS